jgi:hypothetical protein
MRPSEVLVGNMLGSETRGRPNGSEPSSDAWKPTEKSIRLGQVITPPHVATRMANSLLSDRRSGPVRILDPCVGPMTFPEALFRSGLLAQKDLLTCFDVDPEMIAAGRSRPPKSRPSTTLICEDYLLSDQSNSFDYAILNPPYIRQEWIQAKAIYGRVFWDRYDITLPGTSNLYCYFLVKVVWDLTEGGRFCCIVYDSLQSTKYGAFLLNWLEDSCSQLRTENPGPQPFRGRLIDATIIFGEKRKKIERRSIPLNLPRLERRGQSLFSGVEGFTPLHCLFNAKRGLRLKQANFFLIDRKSGHRLGATPFVKKIALVSGYSVRQDHPEAALLIHSAQKNMPVHKELLRRLEAAREALQKNQSILNWVKQRPHQWYLHARPPHARILFNYYIRNAPRHIYNPIGAFADNFYGLTWDYDIPALAMLATLNSSAVREEIFSRARNQGNGLFKLQLYEYRQLYLPDLRLLGKREINRLAQLGQKLIESSAEWTDEIDRLLFKIYRNPKLDPREFEAKRAPRLGQLEHLSS